MRTVTPDVRKQTTVVMGFLSEMESTLGGQLHEVIYPFVRTRTITSAAAAAGVDFITDAEVPKGCVPYIYDFHARVNGTTGWGTTATVKVQDRATVPVDFITFAVAAMTNQARLFPGTANVTIENAYSLMTGGTVDKGIRMIGNANGTGSDFVCTIIGYYRRVVKK